MSGSVYDHDRGPTNIQDEATRLARATTWVWFRAALERADDGPANALMIELTTGASPENFERQEWDYGHLVLVAGVVDGPTASGWLTASAGEMLGAQLVLPFVVPRLPNTGHWQRLPSRSLLDQPTLRWPSRRATFSAGQMIGPACRPAFLVGPSAPSFPSFEAAFEEFFHDQSPTTVPGRSADLLVIRDQPEQVRIDRVAFSAASVEIRLGADKRFASEHPGSVRVEFGGGGRSTPTSVYLDGRKEEAAAKFDLPDGVPDDWWVVLSVGNNWLDFRQFSRYGRWPADAERLPGALDPNDEVRMLMFGGEGVVTEFKSELPRDDDGKRRLSRTVAAFANGQGGTVLFGIDRDEVTIVGIAGGVAAARDRLTNIVSDNLTPRPDVRVDHFETDEGLVVALVVEMGLNRPYGVDARKPCFFIRRNATTVPARQEEVVALARSAMTASQLRWSSL